MSVFLINVDDNNKIMIKLSLVIWIHIGVRIRITQSLDEVDVIQTGDKEASSTRAHNYLLEL